MLDTNSLLGKYPGVIGQIGFYYYFFIILDGLL